jgi:hypothetical protein
MKQIIFASIATIALAGAGRDPWRVFGGPNGDGVCHAVTDEELYQAKCSIAVHVRQNDRTPLIHEQDDKYNQFMPRHVFDFNLQTSMEKNQEAIKKFAAKELRHERCNAENTKVYCIGAVLEKDGRGVFDHFRKGCTFARMALDVDADNTCFLNTLDKLVSNNRCNNFFYLGQYENWINECSAGLDM